MTEEIASIQTKQETLTQNLPEHLYYSRVNFKTVIGTTKLQIEHIPLHLTQAREVKEVTCGSKSKMELQNTRREKNASTLAPTAHREAESCFMSKNPFATLVTREPETNKTHHTHTIRQKRFLVL